MAVQACLAHYHLDLVVGEQRFQQAEQLGVHAEHLQQVGVGNPPSIRTAFGGPVPAQNLGEGGLDGVGTPRRQKSERDESGELPKRGKTLLLAGECVLLRASSRALPTGPCVPAVRGAIGPIITPATAGLWTMICRRWIGVFAAVEIMPARAVGRG